MRVDGIIGRRRGWVGPVTAAAALLAVATAAPAARFGTPGQWRFMRGAGAGTLPATGSDGHGNTWMVYQPSGLQCQSNMPVYGQTANLTINGQSPQQAGVNAAHVDDKTGELVLDNMQVGTVSLSRRVLIDADDGGVRVVDVFKNPQAAEQQVNVQLTSTINFGVQQSQMVVDPKNAARNLAWVAQVPVGPGRVALDVYAGPGAKVCPTLDGQPGNNVGTATVQLTVPGNGQVALVHYHLIVASTDAGVQWVTAMRPAKMLADLPKDVRRSVVNFRVGGGLLGDQEVLRGDLLDVVELRNGDRLNGNLTDTSYKLDTFYGTVELPVDRVVGIVNAGAYRPRQLLVTADGQIFGGHLQRASIDLELTSGQRVSVPLGQIARVGYRKRAGEPDDADADAGQLKPPYLLLASGDRIGVTLPPEPVPVMTRYGPLSLSPDVLAGIAFANDDTGVHTVTLTDGSHFSGLVTLPEFTATLTAAGTDKAVPVKFPVGSLNRIVFAADEANADESTHAGNDDAPALHVRKDDLLVGTLTGQLKVDTAFDTVTVDAAGVRALSPSKDNPSDLSITTWDGTVFNGQVQDPTAACHLSCGVDVRVPVALIDGYTNPSPTVPALMQAKVAQLVKDLDADDWQARDAAEKELAKLGPAVAGTLKAVRDKQPPEAQQRIDAVLRELKK
jgi:hypothetical protein